MDLLSCVAFGSITLRRLLTWFFVLAPIVWDIHLSQPTCGMPMRLLSFWCCLEICLSTWGKRTTTAAVPPVTKRPAAADSGARGSSDAVAGGAATWDPNDHDLYLRQLLVVNPALGERGLLDVVMKDHWEPKGLCGYGWQMRVLPISHWSSCRCTPLGCNTKVLPTHI